MIDNFTATKNAIVSVLQGISNIKYVYAYEKGLFPGYPVATIYSSEYNPEIYDTGNDNDTYIFTLHLYQEIKKETPANAESIMDNAIIAIVQAFQKDRTIGGKADNLAIKVLKGWVNRELLDRGAVITITTTKNTNITS